MIGLITMGCVDVRKARDKDLPPEGDSEGEEEDEGNGAGEIDGYNKN